MLTHAEFGRLRLKRLFPDRKILEAANYEWLGHAWVSECLAAFTTFSRLHDECDVVRAVEVSRTDLSESDVERIFDALQLPLKMGMTIVQVRAVLGRESEIERRSSDRSTYSFQVGDDPDQYLITTTILDAGGLQYVTMHTPLPPAPDGAG